jgi:hypothetical protein
VLKSDEGGDKDLHIYFNDDTTASNYSGQDPSGKHATPLIGLIPPVANSLHWSDIRIWIQSPASSKIKTAQSMSVKSDSTGTLATDGRPYHVAWESADVIDEITLFPVGGNLLSGSSFELYGYKLQEILVPVILETWSVTFDFSVDDYEEILVPEASAEYAMDHYRNDGTFYKRVILQLDLAEDATIDSVDFDYYIVGSGSSSPYIGVNVDGVGIEANTGVTLDALSTDSVIVNGTSNGFNFNVDHAIADNSGGSADLAQLHKLVIHGSGEIPTELEPYV